MEIEKRIDWLLERIKPGTRGCLEFTGSRKDNYGIFTEKRKRTYIHRFMYFLLNGEIPKNFVICHKCDNPPCCNPEHLFIGTHLDNIKDMVDKGRHVNGSNSGKAKFTDEQIKEIRNSTENNTEIAKRFNVWNSTISRIRTKGAYNNVEGGGKKRTLLAKFTNEQIFEIRASVLSNRKLAAKFQADRSVISRIRSRKTYKDI